jgi:RimJ/RimL family protein N-acetyltransferase
VPTDGHPDGHPGEHRLPVGDPVAGWAGCPAPAPVTLSGRWVRLEPLAAAHAPQLYAATCGPDRAAAWTYLADEMPASPDAFAAYVARRIATPDLVSLSIIPTGRGAEGVASLMRADPANGVVEVGSIVLGAPLQRTTAATEAMWLLARHVFDLGYRRYEWKCDALNAPSRAAAARLGFRYEGTFRNALVYKGRNRDTAWFSITDREWRALAPAYARWLDPAGFEDPVAGTGQRVSLSALTARP